MGTKVDVSEIGRKGGQARSANMTPSERSQAAREAANARWEKARAQKAADAKKKAGGKKAGK